MKNIFQTILIFIFIITLSYQGFAQPGFLDLTFGNNGIVVENRLGYPVGLANLADGKILVPGGLGPYFYMDRFNPDGSNDQGFGIDGRAILNLENRYSVCYCMALQQDGKIILVGSFDATDDPAYLDIAIVRCNPDGVLDSSFGINGLTTVNLSNYDYAYDVAIQTDGKIVIIGNFTKNLDYNYDSYILRVNTDGSLDQSFGNMGITKVHYSLYSRNRALSIQPDGKLLMGGTYGKIEAQPDFMVERFNTNGTVDNSFGENGTAKFNFGEGQQGNWDTDLYDMALQSDGKIVCAGQSGRQLTSMALCKFNTDGTIDYSFGENGSEIAVYKNEESGIENIYIQADNKILASGGTDHCLFLLSRFENTGSLDLGFGENGIQATKISGCPNGRYVIQLPDQKLLVTGYNFNIFLARYNGDNVLAASFKEVKAIQENDNITITWQTLNESNTKSYTVERSSNAKDYAGINTIPAKHAATNSYSYTDKNPLYGDNYYRIKENAANGTNTYSQTLKVNFENSNIISLYPNPAKNNVTIKGLNKNATAIIKITDMNGREISKQYFSNTSSTILSIKALAQGCYFILIEQNGKVTKLRLVKA